MATTKKPAAKTTKRKPAAQKTTTTKKKSTASRKKPTPMSSLKLSRDDHDFISLQFTRQTLYWTIIALAVLGLGIWVAVLNYQIQSIYDQIDSTSSQNSMIYSRMHKPQADIKEK